MERLRQRRVKLGVWSVWGRESQGSWERLGSGWSRGLGAGLGKAVGGRPRGPRGGRRRLGDRMPGSCRRLPPPPRAASWGAGLEPSTHYPSSSQSLRDLLTVPTAAARVPRAFPHPSRPKLPPAPPLAPRRHAPSLFSCCGAAPSPNPSGPLASPLTSQGVSSPEPRLLDSYSTLARSLGRRKAGLLGL